jgi:serine/threonine protein phosphatase 1
MGCAINTERSSNMSTFVIGDPHGQALLLDQLLAGLPIHWETDALVVLGDVIDRGPASQSVIATLMALCAQYPLVTVLRGNHEAMMLQALASEAAFHQWLTIGGDATYRAYCPPTRRMRWDLFVRSVPPEVRAFLERMPYWYRNRDACYVHAGAKRDETGQWVLTDHQTALWSRDPIFFRTYDGPLLVVGHTPTKKIRRLLGELPALDGPPQAWEREQLIAIDCDVSEGGPLCAVELPARQFYYEFPPPGQ